LFATERLRAIEDSAVQILLQRQAIRLDRVRYFFVAVAVFIPFETELLRGRASRVMSPTIGQQHAADVEEDGGNFRHLPAMICRMARLDRHESSAAGGATLLVSIYVVVSV